MLVDDRCLLELVADDGLSANDDCPYHEWCEWPAGPCIKSYEPGTELYEIRKERKDGGPPGS